MFFSPYNVPRKCEVSFASCVQSNCTVRHQYPPLGDANGAGSLLCLYVAEAVYYWRWTGVTFHHSRQRQDGVECVIPWLGQQQQLDTNGFALVTPRD